MSAAPDFKAVGDEIGYLPQAVAFAYGMCGGDMPAAIAYLMSIDDDTPAGSSTGSEKP